MYVDIIISKQKIIGKKEVFEIYSLEYQVIWPCSILSIEVFFIAFVDRTQIYIELK